MKTEYIGVGHCHYRLSAKAIIRNDKGEFALCLKEMMVNGELQRKWDIPGGGIEHSEDVFSTLRREILEEMGLVVTNISQKPTYFFLGESAAGDTPLGLVCHEVDVENFDYTPSDECLEMKFFTLETALKADTYCMVSDALEEVKEKYGEF